MMKKYLSIFIWLIALAMIAGAMLLVEHDFLWKVQQMNLFLNTMMFFKAQMVVPGGLLTWIGTWFTQFLYYPWLGVGLLCCWWLVLLFLIKHTFKTPDHWAVFLLIPVALLLLTNMDMGYWIYMLKLGGHFFVSTIGTTMVVALLWCYRKVVAVTQRHTKRMWMMQGVFIVLVCAVGYPLMGIYGLAAALLMGFWSWRLGIANPSQQQNGQRWNIGDGIILTVVALLSVIAVPLICYRYVYYQINLANIYWAELPLYFITEEHHVYYIPYYLLALFFVVMALTYKEDAVTQRHTKRAWVVQGLTAVVLAAGIWHFWFKDENFHRELAMEHRINNTDWEGVLEVAAKQECEPTRAIVVMRNIALSRLGRQGNEMFLYKNGSRQYEAPFGMRLMLVAGPLIYYQYGMLNYCNRLCMEMGVEFGFRPEYYQLMIRCAILNGDRPLALKYINILKQTTFFSDWAEQARIVLELPTQIEKDEAYSFPARMMHYENVLSGDQGYVEKFLMKQLSSSTYTGDPFFQEQALLATLWTKNIKMFWRRFGDYVRLHPHDPMPRYYQEAAYLYGKIEERAELDQMPFDAGVKDTYERFATSATNYDGEDVRVAREALYPFYGQTYYYDYYMMSQLPEY